MCQVKVNVVTYEYIDSKIVPSPSLYMTNCSTANSLLFFNNDAASEDLTIESFTTKKTSNSIVEEPNQEPAKTETVVLITGTLVKTQ